MENLSTQKGNAEKPENQKFRLIDLLYAKWKTNPHLPEGWLIAIPENYDDPILLCDTQKAKFMYMERPLFKIRGQLEFTETPKPGFGILPFSFHYDNYKNIHCQMYVTGV